MYINQFYRGPRGGDRQVEYDAEITAAILEAELRANPFLVVVLRITTDSGQLNMSMEAHELEILRAALASSASATPASHDPAMAPLAAPTREPPPEYVPDPPTAWDRLLADDDILEAAP